MFRPAFSLTVGNARAVLVAGLDAIARGQTDIDLSGLATVDSAAVATMVSWQRAARSAGKTLTFTGVAPNLHSLIELYGAADLLQVDAHHGHHRAELAGHPQH
ncbi:MAG TPA: STAS domain-containing protein [Noviherbaspirillum sp.]|jgi:phospholipid transport system transporter-binding protein|uniref:STAS domain-containing protein n=1 Tax=Noviherbaspirillum sp. TaxID=1926288 RepID=UPI002F95F862